MKKTAILFMAAMLILVACGKEGSTGSDTPGPGPVEEEPDIELSEYAFKVSFADMSTPDSKTVAGVSADGRLNLSFTAFDEGKEVDGDYFEVVGKVGEIEQFNDNDMTFYALYRVVKVSGGVATLDVAPYPGSMIGNYDDCDYFVISSPYYPFTDADEDDIIDGLAIANTCSKEEMDALFSGKDVVLPLHILNSVIKVEVTVSGNEVPLTFESIYAYFETGEIAWDIDYSRLNEMIQNGEIYSLSSSTWAVDASCQTTIPAGGGSAYLYFCVSPGTFGNPQVGLNARDDRHCIYNYYQLIEMNLDVEAGRMYTMKIDISKEELDETCLFVPYFVVDGSIYDVNDTGYGMDNAQMIGDFLKTCSWVYLAKPGAPEDYDGIDVSGKVVFVNRGSISFGEKILNASDAGAVGIIIVNNQQGNLPMDLSSVEGNPKRIPAVSTTIDLGEYLIEHPGASISLIYSL